MFCISQNIEFLIEFGLVVGTNIKKVWNDKRVCNMVTYFARLPCSSVSLLNMTGETKIEIKNDWETHANRLLKPGN